MKNQKTQGIMYQNKDNNKLAELIEMNEKTKMVILQTEDGPKSTTISTFKRWWKKVEEEDMTVKEEDLVPMPGAEKLAELKEEVAGDGTPLAEVGKEIAAQAKEKAKKATKKKAESFNLDGIISIIPKEITNEICKNGKDVKLRKKDELIAVLYIGSKSTTIYFNSEAVRPLVESKESKEKFAFYGKITSDNNLKEILTTLAKEG